MPTGSCLCQNLKYEITEVPEGMATCHCLSCRKISGGTNTVNFMMPEKDFKITAGAPKRFTHAHENGMNITVHFCDNCGGTIYKTGDREGFRGTAVVQVGTLDDPNAFALAKPTMEMWTKYRVPWLSHIEGTAQMMEF
ncbi:hypothetical protein PENANT_c001G01963 [Penicillium antarcticum]|uniref:CENP-V/GFA domain-containing protein n=1 Tax=Penicillium antarcticum TaxID=416450 RepID=A0A1V6QMM1_9EURO|nr:uncharacterized protein N7508_010220 [Penicillium antarcticum]KAJ5295399.1 hypothetical protein N7508_010220 [Penicillium antarcticum]OQD90469.1 hypothetical protein PENANT_c001G01963 [Penicillium antarcticum]